MGKFVSAARRLRFEYEAKQNRRVPIREVAEIIGIDRKVLTRIELDKMQLVDLHVLQKLADFYHQAGLNASDILRYDPEKQRTPESVAA